MPARVWILPFVVLLIVLSLSVNLLYGGTLTEKFDILERPVSTVNKYFTLTQHQTGTATVTTTVTTMPEITLPPADFMTNVDKTVEQILRNLQESDDDKKQKFKQEQRNIDNSVPFPPEREEKHNKLKKLHEEYDEQSILNKIVQLAPEDRNSEGKAEPHGAKIVIVSGYDGKGFYSNKTMIDMAYGNRQEYANYRGYINYFVDTSQFQSEENPSAGEWLKVAAMKVAYNKYPAAQWFWWLDLDMIIMNLEVDLAEFILHPKVLGEKLSYGLPLLDRDYHYSGQFPARSEVNVNDIDILMVQDVTSINTGSMFCRRSEFMNLFLELWDDESMKRLNFKRYEQDTLLYLALSKPSIFKHLGVVPQRLLNSYHSEAPFWEEGDLAIHFAGVIKNNMDQYIEAWEKRWSERRRPPQEYWYGGERGFKDNRE